jgi:hypothetical protein
MLLPLATSADLSVTLFDLRSGANVSAAIKFPYRASWPRLSSPKLSGAQFGNGAYGRVVRIWDVYSATREVTSARMWDGQEALALDCVGGVMPSWARVELKYGARVAGVDGRL